MEDSELFAFHRELVSTPSISGNETHVADLVEQKLRANCLDPVRFNDSVYAVIGDRGPLICLNSHIDTVPPSAGWTRPPYQPDVVDGKVYGLGANDAKASVAAMIAASLRLTQQLRHVSCRLLLTLVAGEEIGGKGSELLLPELRKRGLTPHYVIVGEPTGLDIAVAQKGLLIVELHEQGRACHAAHGKALGAPNALRLLAHDICALDTIDLGPAHETLGPMTIEPTVASGGTAKNVIPSSAQCVFDIRTNPHPDHDSLLLTLQRAVEGELRVLSKDCTHALSMCRIRWCVRR